MSPKAAVVEILGIDPDAVTTRDQARYLVKRAKKLGRCDLLTPRVLELAESKTSRTPLTSANKNSPDTARANGGPAAISDRERCIAAKSDEHGIPAAVLRTVFQRGLREYTEMPRDDRTPVGAEQVANARVNAFVRLVYSDPIARDCDADLLAMVPDRPRR